jgi:hypothetical protein
VRAVTSYDAPAGGRAPAWRAGFDPALDLTEPPCLTIEADAGGEEEAPTTTASTVFRSECDQAVERGDDVVVPNPA